MKKKTLKITVTLVSALLAIALLAGCGSTDNKENAKPQQQQSQQAASGAKPSGLTAAAFEQPILITSVGQSADGQMIKALAERNSLKFTYDPLVAPAEVSKYKTLMLVVGGSSKGMGAAGINAVQEEQRTKDMVAKAKASNVKVIVAHVGGESRRGEMTDKFITVTAPQADYMIVVADGDKDQIFAKAAAGKIPVDYPKSIAEVGNFLKKAIKQ